MKFVAADGGVQRVCWEAEIGDRVAVDARLAVRWVRNGVGYEAYVDGGIV